MFLTSKSRNIDNTPRRHSKTISNSTRQTIQISDPLQDEDESPIEHDLSEFLPKERFARFRDQQESHTCMRLLNTKDKSLRPLGGCLGEARRMDPGGETAAEGELE
jgi:hypothetical protein